MDVERPYGGEGAAIGSKSSGLGRRAGGAADEAAAGGGEVGAGAAGLGAGVVGLDKGDDGAGVAGGAAVAGQPHRRAEPLPEPEVFERRPADPGAGEAVAGDRGAGEAGVGRDRPVAEEQAVAAP